MQKILENKKLVYFIINKYYPERRNDEDIIQVGMIGLWKAIELFDESKGYKFSTFATTVIRNAIKQELRSEKTDSRRANLDCNQLFQEEDEEQMYEEIDPTDAMDSQLSIEAYKEKLCKVDKIILQLKRRRRNKCLNSRHSKLLRRNCKKSMEKNHAGDRRTMYVTQIVAFATGALFAAIAISMYYERELQKGKRKMV